MTRNPDIPNLNSSDLECPDNHVSNPVIVRGPFVVCVKTDLHEGGLEENIRMLNLDETFQNYIHFG